jgi:hypothetical protein
MIPHFSNHHKDDPQLTDNSIHEFLTLRWCKSGTSSVQIIFQILIFIWSSDKESDMTLSLAAGL